MHLRFHLGSARPVLGLKEFEVRAGRYGRLEVGGLQDRLRTGGDEFDF